MAFSPREIEEISRHFAALTAIQRLRPPAAALRAGAQVVEPMDLSLSMTLTIVLLACPAWRVAK